jgi:hypothetical protein
MYPKDGLDIPDEKFARTDRESDDEPGSPSWLAESDVVF